MIPDPLGALRTILGLDANITALVTTAPAAARIFVGELPEVEAQAQPRSAVLVQPAGGLPEPGTAQLAQPRIDVRCYGRTPNEAWRLSLQVHESLKAIQRRIATATSSGDKALIHSATPSGGPTLLRDNDGQWPMVLRTYTLFVSEVAVP